MYKEHFHQALKQIRESQGLTQQQVADTTGISRVQISRLELGTREPNLETLGILLDYYNISAKELLGTQK